MSEQLAAWPSLKRGYRQESAAMQRLRSATSACDAKFIQYITHIACEPGSASRSVGIGLPDFQAHAVGSRRH